MAGFHYGKNFYLSENTFNQVFFPDQNCLFTFLDLCNGVTYYDTSQVNEQVHLHAFLTSLKVVYNSMIYALPTPKDYPNYTVFLLEISNILAACIMWDSDKRVESFGSNLAVVEVLTTGKAGDPTLATSARNIWHLSSLNSIHLDTVFRISRTHAQLQVD